MAGVNGKRTYQLNALTDLWTGSVTLEERNGQIKEKTGPDRLITTGLLGSIRWWFEALVRGLDGSACDPTHTECEGRNHCVVCELFGCTGWARKFRFEILDEKGDVKADQIKKNQTFSLRFIPLRPICGEEWALLDATLRLIAEYGAIGGKTVFKPTGESSRAKEIHHQDYGIVEIVNVDPKIVVSNVAEVRQYIFEERWRKPEPVKGADCSWASLKCFWFIDRKTLTRENNGSSSFNKVLGRKESKACRDCRQVHNPPNKCQKTKRPPERESEHLVNRNDEISKWLAGSQQESKKVFSFKNPARTFGFVKPGKTAADTKKEFEEMKK
ncbi:MAG: type III-B CRISPR module RAMP protein Cmr1, partial [Kiritimatiellia bacterium]